MSQLIWYFSCAIAVYASVLLTKWHRKRKSRLPYPPGPKGLPLIGNVRDMPQGNECETYAQWSRQYNSGLIHVKLPGEHMIVVNSAKAATELLDRRSAIYSDRPRIPMLTELMSWDMLIFYRYGPKWRATRRLFHQFFNINSASQFQPQGAKAVHELLHRLAQTPNDYRDHLRLMAGSFILDVTYGIDVRSADNRYIRMAEESMQMGSEAAVPGAFLVDTIPLLKYVPDWFPGAGFKKKAKKWGKITSDAQVQPFEYVKDGIAKGTYTPSVVSQALKQCMGNEEEEIIRAVGGIAYFGGADTTVSSLLTFFLAMVLHPEVVRKAQEELDAVVGPDRLPDFSDKPSLPYISAIVKEVLRWHPVTPLAFPHRLMVDDIYDGMFLPAGSLVLANAWAILRDEAVYKNPAAFNPDRFMKDGELDPDVKSPDFAAFGFGRRICPGRHLALESIFLNVACILATFDIGRAIDEHGKPIVPKEELTSGLFRRPVPFQCSIKPRSRQASTLISETYALHNAQS